MRIVRCASGSVDFPLMIALIAIITFILLARAFRSLLLPLKAVVLNVISVGAAWGVLDLVWQRGHGSRPRRRDPRESGCGPICKKAGP